MKLQMETQTGTKTFEEGFVEFIRYCKVRNYSEATIGNYQALKKKINSYWSVEQDLKELTSAVTDNFILYLKDECQLSDMSLGVYFKNLKALLNYFVRMGYMTPVTLPKLRLEKKVKATYTDNELTLLLKKPDMRRCDFCEYRDWVIVNYLLSTGNRVSTVINLHIEDIDFDAQIICLTKTKNRKQQIIPLSRISEILCK